MMPYRKRPDEYLLCPTCSGIGSVYIHEHSSGHNNQPCRTCDGDGEIEFGDMSTELKVSRMLIIGLSGAAESGKNTVASMIHDIGVARGHEITEDAFARVMKLMLEKTNPTVMTRRNGFISLKELLEENPDETWNDKWDRAKAEPEVRALLQRFGTDAGRNVLGDDFWTNLVEKNLIEHAEQGVDVFIITDARFPEEQKLVKRHAGVLVHVERPHTNGLGDNNAHVSEKSIDTSIIDRILVNDGTLDDLKNKTHLLMNDLFQHHVL